MKPVKLETETDDEFAARLKTWEDEQAAAAALEAEEKDKASWLTKSTALEQQIAELTTRLANAEGRPDQSTAVAELTAKLEKLEASHSQALEQLNKVRPRSRVEAKASQRNANTSPAPRKAKRDRKAWV